jgi:F-type H+-transporting ATPase subunit delta
MAQSNLARPYARAAFALAQENGDLAGWSERLSVLASVVADERVDAALRAPSMSRSERGELVLRVVPVQLDAAATNLVRLLADNGRLMLVPQLSAQFERLRRDAESRVEAQVRSAAPLTEDQRQRLTERLRERLKREVTLHCIVDETLLGGAIVRAGDLVIDGSIRGRLDRLATRLAH